MNHIVFSCKTYYSNIKFFLFLILLIIKRNHMSEVKPIGQKITENIAEIANKSDDITKINTVTETTYKKLEDVETLLKQYTLSFAEISSSVKDMHTNTLEKYSDTSNLLYQLNTD